MSAVQGPRIVVVGGTGVTGRKVAQYLVQYLQQPGRIDVTSRRPKKLANHRVFNPANRAASIATLAEYDVAIICAGPFEQLGAAIHELCIEAGTSCVDVNDAIDAARDIARLDESAASRSVRVITGCGFNPGISTAMLCRWRGHDVVEVRERLRSESGEAGATALHSLLMTLATERRCLTNGAESLQQQPVIEAGAVRYESPDIDGVRRIWPAVQEFRYQVQFSGLPERSVRTLSSRKIYKQPVVQRGLAKLLAAVARRRAANVAEPPASTLEVVARDQVGNTYIQRLQGAGSYDLTAFAAAQCALWMLRHRATLQGGVHTIDCVNGLGDFLLFQLQQCAMATIDQYEQEDM